LPRKFRTASLAPALPLDPLREWCGARPPHDLATRGEKIKTLFEWIFLGVPPITALNPIIIPLTSHWYVIFRSSMRHPINIPWKIPLDPIKWSVAIPVLNPINGSMEHWYSHYYMYIICILYYIICILYYIIIIL
jgi:hypothetical protein